MTSGYILDSTNGLSQKCHILVDWRMKLVILHNLFKKFASEVEEWKRADSGREYEIGKGLLLSWTNFRIFKWQKESGEEEVESTAWWEGLILDNVITKGKNKHICMNSGRFIDLVVKIIRVIALWSLLFTLQSRRKFIGECRGKL